MARTLTFYFDFISPYAYLAWTQIHRVVGDAAVVEPRPVLFAGMLNAHGTRGPAEVPARRSYLIRDVVRLAHHHGGVPLAPPPAHPFDPLLALRVATAEPAHVDALFRAAWAESRDVSDAGVVTAIVGAAAVARAGDPEVKAALRANTEAAIARGAFGVPTMVVDDQLFWGCDSLPHLAHYLAHGDVVDAALAAKWEALPASATRRVR